MSISFIKGLINANEKTFIFDLQDGLKSHFDLSNIWIPYLNMDVSYANTHMVR